MANNSADVEDECFVYPAITKRYSQVTLPTPDTETANPQNTPKTRPLRSTLKTRSQFETENCDKTHHQVSSTRADQPDKLGKSEGPLWNDTEASPETSYLTVEPRQMSKRTSIQQLRKYSVVDPNALKYFEGEFPRVTINLQYNCRNSSYEHRRFGAIQ
ncbi:Mechanosensory protein 2 [Fasciolopsis buskii]|uniref:Mechanosensory protein 2 n=1 Tax=Fasciolopsis buskii TaxID=27845 RepID=A0A8E0RYR1_9TREM|nr:Mechanosensory protein 2 [Fasciolopsis buski]